MAITVTFHGACGIVTGSCYEVRTRRAAVLVDCGMFQGTKTVKALNYGRFPFDPASIQAVALTHAHIDHCGLLPKLSRLGFSGPVVCTPGTADLLTYVLPDSGFIQETEVSRLNRRNRQRGIAEVEPIYTREDAEKFLRHAVPRPFDKWVDLAPGIRIRFWDAGHILGSASIEMRVDEKGDAAGDDAMVLLFSGDIGPGDKAIQGKPKAPAGVDYLFAESTYGDRTREPRSTAQRRHLLKKEIMAGLKAGGMILIPTFAIERTQELLVDLDGLFDSGELPTLPVFVDSPLASKATDVFAHHLKEILTTDGTHAFKRANVRFVEDAAASKRLNRLRSGAIIMAGSGMCDAGRIRHHLKNHLCRSDATVILVGYQAPGTLGRLLLDGARMVRIHGEEVTVSARIRKLDEYSGHADQRGLLKWIEGRVPVRREIFLIHGEDPAREALRKELVETGFDKKRVRLPAVGETVRLTSHGARTVRVRAPADVSAAAQHDWHNTYADTVLSLRRKLDALKTDKARERLLRRLRGTIGA